MTTAFPALQPAPLVELATRLRSLRTELYTTVGSLDRVAIMRERGWTGRDSDAFGARINELAAAVAGFAEAAAAAAPPLQELAAAIDATRSGYDAAVALERQALPHLPDTANAVAAAQTAQRQTVAAVRAADERCAAAIDAVTAQLLALDGDPLTPGTDVPSRTIDGVTYGGTEVDPLWMLRQGWLGIQILPRGPAVAVGPALEQVDADRMPLPGQRQVDHRGRRLPDTDPAVRWLLPERGDGYVVYNRDDSRLGPGAPSEFRARVGGGPAGVHDQVGTRQLIERQQALAREWATRNPGSVLEYGDVSLQGGVDTNDHSTHGDGQAFDMRPLRTGGSGGLTYNSANYDRDATRDFIRLVREQHPDSRVLFNDPQIRNDPEFAGYVRYSSGHDNHLHVVIGDD